MKKLKEYIAKVFESSYSPLVLIALSMVIGGFVSKLGSRNSVEEVKITLHNSLGNHFVAEEDIRKNLDHHNQMVLGLPLRDVEFKEIERNILENPYVSQAEAYGNYSGILNLEVWIRKPLFRIIERNGNSVYISRDKEILPLSDRYSSRGLLVTGKGCDSMMVDSYWRSDEGDQFFQLMEYINEDPFWKAQIAMLEVDKKGDITLYPQVTKQKILFGDLEGFEEKFERLLVFYDRILPLKGWNHYSEVNLKFKDQIVCY